MNVYVKDIKSIEYISTHIDNYSLQIPGFYMLILMPNDGIDGIKRMEHNLSFLNFNRNDLPISVLCDLSLPKFKVENDLDLNGSLKKVTSIWFFILNIYLIFYILKLVCF